MKYVIAVVLMVLCACRGPVGPTGDRGEPGQSIVGAQGPAGQDGTEITPVKFCHQTANYPSTFPEYGLCINGQLFAVYSQNDGFLALIPNGTYHSNAVGSVCNFVVNGCQVSEQ